MMCKASAGFSGAAFVLLASQAVVEMVFYAVIYEVFLDLIQRQVYIFTR